MSASQAAASSQMRPAAEKGAGVRRMADRSLRRPVSLGSAAGAPPHAREPGPIFRPRGGRDQLANSLPERNSLPPPCARGAPNVLRGADAGSACKCEHCAAGTPESELPPRLLRCDQPGKGDPKTPEGCRGKAWGPTGPQKRALRFIPQVGRCTCRTNLVCECCKLRGMQVCNLARLGCRFYVLVLCSTRAAWGADSALRASNSQVCPCCPTAAVQQSVRQAQSTGVSAVTAAAGPQPRWGAAPAG